LRKEAVERLIEIGFDGYAIGGLSVGEPEELRYNILNFVGPILPREFPHYLMGVGTPVDILEAVSLGIDMFDCVLPTRGGRNGLAFTRRGRLNLRNACFAFDQRPVDEECNCMACRTYSRSYVRHLLLADEILGLRLLSLHNIYFYLQLMRQIRQAIAEDRFGEFKKDFVERYNQGD
jgi:queuine tRNA-ribosyltransferase